MRKRLSLAIALSTALSLGATSAVVADSATLDLTFEKSLVRANTWSGTVGGDSTGTIETLLTAVEPAGSTWRVTFDWQVELDGNARFVAEVGGVINLRTGRVVMNGDVLDGYLAGSKIHVEAQLDLADLSSQGTMRISP